MNTDSYFAIGSSHTVCEDYACHNSECAVVSDGCSHGGTNNLYKTDFGARFLALAAMEHLPLFDQQSEDAFAAAVIGASNNMRRALGLDIGSLAATLIVLKHNEDKIIGFMCGDGVMGGRRTDGTWNINIIEYPSGAPLYLRYLMTKADCLNYISMFGSKVNETTVVGDISDPQGHDKKENVWDATQKLFFHGEYPVDEYEFVFAASDGIMSFKKLVQTETSKHHERIDVLDAVNSLLNIKRFNGDFLRRHVQWQFQKDLGDTIKSKQWIHDDDLGLGAIYCGS
jgi:hypothetical protein